MRAKVVVSTSILAVAILLPTAYFHFKPDSQLSPTTDQQPVATENNPAPAGDIPSILKHAVREHPQEGLPTRPPVTENLVGSDHDNYVMERKSQLIDMGMSGNPAALKTILSELENPEPEIRQTALTATIDFGSKDAIPVLQNEMAYATDPQEKVDIKKAIEFLQLPSFGSGGAITQQSTDQAPPANN